MSLRDTQNFLARIYTDENLRHTFLQYPETVGKENNLSEMEIAELSEIVPSELNIFAESLFYKRLHETEKLLPLTRKILAAGFEKHFRGFALTFSPQTIKTHITDAIKFAEFLQSKEIGLNVGKDLAKFEAAKLEFYGLNKFFVIKVFHYDVKRITFQNLPAQNEIRRRRTVGIWLRIGERKIAF